MVVGAGWMNLFIHAQFHWGERLTKASFLLQNITSYQIINFSWPWMAIVLCKISHHLTSFQLQGENESLQIPLLVCQLL